MEFKLSELQQDIANLAKDFAEKKLAPTVKDRDEKEVFDRAISTKWVLSAFSVFLGKKKTAA